MDARLRTFQALVVTAGLAFLLGMQLARPVALDAQGGGRGPDRPPRRDVEVRDRTTAQPLVYGGDSGVAASANGILAVTGSYGVGTSVLYVIDTESRQLAVYEARGGSPGSRRLYLVGARRIDLDLQLIGYRDESEYSYTDLQRRFQALDAPAEPTVPAAREVVPTPGGVGGEAGGEGPTPPAGGRGR